jgi:hypothetical protein
MTVTAIAIDELGWALLASVRDQIPAQGSAREAVASTTSWIKAVKENRRFIHARLCGRLHLFITARRLFALFDSVGNGGTLLPDFRLSTCKPPRLRRSQPTGG